MNKLCDNHKYHDIINLPHHTSPRRSHMAMTDRVAQFFPFAALTGYDAAVKETARLADRRIELDEYEKADLDERLRLIQEHLGEQPDIKIKFFKPDERKAGGAYLSITGVIKKIDSFERYVVMIDGKKIPIDEISRIDGALFRLLENESI